MAASALLGLSLLVIGESHMSAKEYLINPLHDELTKQGAIVHSVGACGSNAGDWLKISPAPCGGDRKGNQKAVFKGRDATTTPIQQLIAADKPDLIVMIIGDTMASYGKPFPQTWAWQNVTNLTKVIADSHVACIWVGPAWGNSGGKYVKTDERVKYMSTFLKNNVAPCTYVDSLSFSKPSQWETLDGEHFTPPGYKSWSNQITESIVASPFVASRKK